MKQRNKEKEIKMHQHTDNAGKKFGKLHPENAVHKKEKTQQYHIESLKRASSSLVWQ